MPHFVCYEEKPVTYDMLFCYLLFSSDMTAHLKSLFFYSKVTLRDHIGCKSDERDMGLIWILT